MRNFSSGVSVTRSNFPFRSRIHCENEIPSRSGGFGRVSQTTAQHAIESSAATITFLDTIALLVVILIPQLREKDLTHEARITLITTRDRSSCGRSALHSVAIPAFGMTSLLRGRHLLGMTSIIVSR